MFKTEITENDIKSSIELVLGERVYIYEEKVDEGRRITITTFKTKKVIYDRTIITGDKYKIIVMDLISKAFKKKK